MSEEFVLNTTVSYWNTDREQVMLLRGVFGLLQEAAVKHADVFGLGSRVAAMRGESWVLNRMAARISRYPRYEEALRVVTWSAGIRGFRGYRDYRVYAEDELVISASTLWLYLNLKTKALTRVPEDIAATIPARSADVFQPDLEKMKFTALGAAASRHEISVRYSDVDSNEHVNNTAYFDYLQTALRQADLAVRPREISIQFLKEILPEVATVAVALERRSSAIAFALASPEGLCAQGTLS
jgi:medium-chain acyl-[acyl-carrier-protein] hydrolase